MRVLNTGASIVILLPSIEVINRLNKIFSAPGDHGTSTPGSAPGWSE